MEDATKEGLLALRPILGTSGQTSEYPEAVRLIRRGLMYPHVFEVADAVLYRSPRELGTSLLLPRRFRSAYGAGVLGYAMVGKTGGPDAAVAAYEQAVIARHGNVVEAVASLVGISEDLVGRLYLAGVRHKVPAGVIADYLAHTSRY